MEPGPACKTELDHRIIFALRPGEPRRRCSPRPSPADSTEGPSPPACERWGRDDRVVGLIGVAAVAFVRLPDGRAAVAMRAGVRRLRRTKAMAWWPGQGRGAVDSPRPERRRRPARSSGPNRACRSTSDAILGPADGLPLDAAAGLGVPWRLFDDVVVGWRASIERWRSVLGDAVTDSALGAELDGPAGWCLLHGDCHHGQRPRRRGAGWLAIDPQPLIGPPAYDLATAVWSGPESEVEVEDRMAGLAGGCRIGVDCC